MREQYNWIIYYGNKKTIDYINYRKNKHPQVQISIF